jgi:hypothetical protein
VVKDRMLKVDDMAPVMDTRQEEKEVRAGLRRRYLRQRLTPIGASLRAPTRRDLAVVTTGQNIRRQPDADEADSDDDNSDQEEAAARTGRQREDVDSDSDDDDEYRNNQPVTTVAVPEPETLSPTVRTFPPALLVPSTTSTSIARPSSIWPATPPTPTFPVLPPPPPPAVITMPPTTIVMTSTVVATPKPSANAPVANNPQVNYPPPVRMSTSISMMTTEPLSLVSSISVSSQPRKGVGNPETTSSPTSSPTPTGNTQTTPLAFEKSTPTPTPYLEDVRNGNDGGRDQDRGTSRGLDPTAEHALIGAGSIGKLAAQSAYSEHPLANYHATRWIHHCMLHLLDGMAYG